MWRNGSASDYESGGCSFEYYLGHFFFPFEYGLLQSIIQYHGKVIIRVAIVCAPPCRIYVLRESRKENCVELGDGLIGTISPPSSPWTFAKLKSQAVTSEDKTPWHEDVVDRHRNVRKPHYFSLSCMDENNDKTMGQNGRDLTFVSWIYD